MLFNSYSFIFAFLPLTVIGFMLVNRLGSRSANLGWLVLCSMVFYGAWNPSNLVIILPSIAINYGLAIWIRAQLAHGESRNRLVNLLLAAGILFNLCFLGYFKYKNFFLGSANDLFGTDLPLVAIALPLGISFITFQKIAFLVDVRSGAIRDFDLFDFLTFVFFFPQLIAGPIVHYREMMPQFASINSRLDPENIAVGACLFSIGLFKKVVLADGIAAYVPGVFTSAAQGDTVTFFAGWMAALAYTFQIYFDFSGYSDMALGLARIFGIKLPMNFNSPLKSSSIIEFWSRWHITLTRFLTAYVYTPIVMSLTRSRMQAGKPVLTRKRPTLGAFVTLAAWPTVFTMFLSGFWHGAGYTYLVWGLLHGGYLVINHGWRQWRPKWDKAAYEKTMKPIGFLLTFGAVVIAMVLFRANSLGAAGHILHGMAGLDGFTIPEAILNRLGTLGSQLQSAGIRADGTSGAAFSFATAWMVALFLIATVMPNSLELLRRYQPALYFDPGAGSAAVQSGNVNRSGAWGRAQAVTWNTRWAVIFAGFFAVGALGLNRVSEFLYWQF